MKISLAWINEFVNVEDYFSKPDELGKKLTAVGFEIEAIIDRAKQFQNVVIGAVKVRGQHPDADRLTLCQIDIGDGTLRQIVCGAKNHKEGDHVVVALPGAVLPGDFAIKLSKIRGVESQGMLCSTTELGIDGDGEGIVILPKDTKLGTPFAEYLGAKDIVFEVNVTPNRADGLSHLGLAREISVILDRPLKDGTKKIKTGAGSTKKSVSVELKAKDLCPRYSGRMVFGVQVKQSPAWLKSRLEAVGLNSINNVVDVTNYVMMELGQPLHAFDVREIKKNTLIVEKAKAGEAFTTLDGTELKLKGEELTIRDGERPVALAGAIGGKNSGVKDDTKDVFVEAAYFLPSSVRRTMRAHGLETDSGQRFSRGIDPDITITALDRACELLVEVAGGEIASDHIDNYPSPVVQKPIDFKLSQLEERLGYPASENDFLNWMKRLGCAVKEKSKGQYQVTPPAYRGDLQLPEDLVEEFGRLQGYDLIPETLPVFTNAPTNHSAEYLATEKLVEALRDQGFHQAVNYAFLADKVQASFGFKEENGKPILVQNPLSEDLNAMRMSLIPKLFENCVYNCRRGMDSGKLFEVGNVFSLQGSKRLEELRVAAVAWGHDSALWNKASGAPLLYELKDTLTAVAKQFFVDKIELRTVKSVSGFAHPFQSADVVMRGQVVGQITTLHPLWLDEYKLKGPVAFFELKAEPFVKLKAKHPAIKKLSPFPLVQRDFTFTVTQDFASEKITTTIKKAVQEYLFDVEVVDRFQGGTLQPNEHALTYRVTLQNSKQTFTDDELKTLQKTIFDKVSTDHGTK